MNTCPKAAVAVSMLVPSRIHAKYQLRQNAESPCNPQLCRVFNPKITHSILRRPIIFMCVRGIQFSSIPSRKHSWHLALPVHKQRRREAITDSSLSGAWRLSLAEGIGRAGGLADAQADPASIFLYRGETREVAQLLGIDCTPYPGPIIPGYLQSQLAGSRRLFLGIKVRDEE